MSDSKILKYNNMKRLPYRHTDKIEGKGGEPEGWVEYKRMRHHSNCNKESNKKFPILCSKEVQFFLAGQKCSSSPLEKVGGGELGR